MREKILPTRREERLVIGTAVVGVGPLERLPLPLAKGKRHFGVDALSEVEPMGMVLRRSEDQLGRRDVAGVEIERPRLRMSAERGIFRLPSVRLALDPGKLAGIDERLAGDELLFESVAHRRRVICRLDEVESLAHQCERRKMLPNSLARPIERGRVPAARGDKQQYSVGLVDVTHNSGTKLQHKIHSSHKAVLLSALERLLV